MSKELAKTYDPKRVEEKIYAKWQESGFFNPDKLPKGRKTPFTIIMPPPNANGALHIGHAVFVTLQDIMIRFWRMRGRKTLWLPGADHAGFETQVVFDKKLEKEGRSRFALPRDELYREMMTFTLENKKVMEAQLKKLGASCDWSREKFTLDPDIVKIAADTFIKLYQDGLLYRGERIVNWCVKHQTTLSDLEVKYVERKDPLYYIKYGPLTLATVRPETKFGDTAVAVHPKDQRYKKYVGKEIEIETLIGRAKMKVIADEAVDPDFGTGVVKVTPAHDPADFEIGKRHNLEVREVIGKDGRLNEKTGPYAGLKVMEARKKVAEDMAKQGLLVKVDSNYTHNVAVCYKCESVVEPLVMPQWFIRMTAEPHAEIRNSKFEIRNSRRKSLRDMAVQAVKSGKIKFVPKRFEKIFFHWMKNLRDWNISRQIVWGIRIPAWFCVGCGEVRMNPRIKGNWFFVRHGETDWNREHRTQGHTDIPLNEQGRKQARAAAQYFQGHDIDLIISSDLRRAKETAEIIAKKIGAEMVADRRLRERYFGTWEGKTREEIGEETLRKFRETQLGPDGGETFEELEARVKEALRHHKDHHRHKNVVIVGHGGTLRAVLAGVKGMKDFRQVVFRNTDILHLDLSEQCKKCGSDFIEQDPDVLDTWFSSGQWPFATLMTAGHQSRSDAKLSAKGGSAFGGKIQNAKFRSDFETFYPTDVMETGWDILFFWVARMIMLGLYRTGQVPFRTVYLHGLVRDKDRQKMSKSKGNVIDPLGVAELYGTDAVRMALVVGNLPGSDIVISEEKIRGYRNFANKLWNIHRFIMMQKKLKDDLRPELRSRERQKTKARFTAEDQKRRSELVALAKRVTSDLENLRFHHAAEILYHYTWHTFADKIIESAKPRLRSEDGQERETALALLLEIHSTLLKLLHPFMPFITEALWQDLQKSKIQNPKDERRKTKAQSRKTNAKNLLIIAPWPKGNSSVISH